MEYNEFCRDGNGNWVRSKEYEWTWQHLNSEHDSGAYGDYSRQVAQGNDTALLTALLFEAGIRSEGVITPLMTKSIFTEPQDTTDVYDLIRNFVSEEKFQGLLTKYSKIKGEFIKRFKAHRDEVEKTHGNDSKPKPKVRRFRIGG